MNPIAVFASLVLLISVEQLQAVCPTGIAQGPCIPLTGSGLCPPDNYCHVNPDSSNECCSGTAPPTTPCVDLLSECPKNVAQCNVNSYRVFMTTNCPLTCGRCGVTGCSDAQTLCTQWAAAGFCQNTFYTTAFKQENCRATCGYC